MSIRTQTNRDFVSVQYENVQRNKDLSLKHVHSNVINSEQKEKTDNGDTLTISGEAMDKLHSEEEKSLLESYQEQVEAGKEAANAFEDMAKMMEIARRIANGDKVPAKDEQKLMEYNSELYQAAKSAAILNEDKNHKKYKTMFEEEEDTKDSDESSSSTEDATEVEGIEETSSVEGTPTESVPTE